jgi:nucleoside-diphosphate-sugar epimerase
MLKKILLFGATGRTGQLVLVYALSKGYEVTALVRNPEKLTIKSDKLTIIKGLPSNIDDVRKAIIGCHAVVSTLSGLPESDIVTLKKVKPSHIMETTIRNTIACMYESGIKDVVTLSSLGVGNSYAYAPWYMRLGIKLTNLKISFADHNAQELLLQQSNLNWVIVRPVGLNDQSGAKQLDVSYTRKPAGLSISRKRVAQFIIDSLSNNEFINKSPVIAAY